MIAYKDIKKIGFTVVEMLIVVVMMSLIFTAVINLYFHMTKVKVDIEARQALLQNSYNLLERLNVMMEDYTIDYEEYFNRRVVWCDSNDWNNFSWDVNNVGWNWYCDKFTAYGNWSWDNASEWKLYSCSSSNNENNAPKYVNQHNDVIYWLWCWNNSLAWWTYHTNSLWNPQSFGEYSLQYRDVLEDVDGANWLIWDDDDITYGTWPIAIADNVNVQELYLISKDWAKRMFIRRALVYSWDWNMTWWIWDVDIDTLYNLQMLKFRWFDAGADHDFDAAITDVYTYDGDIDTWACDYWEWFLCRWTNIWAAYPNYNLPADIDDGWVDIFGKELTIVDWNMSIYPTKNYNNSWSEDTMYINPYITIKVSTKLYWEPWAWKVNPSVLDSYQLNLQTTFNIKTNY